jgi:beta-carotene 3-hydroxylase
MTTLAFDIVLFLAAFAFMEGFAWVTHRYVMHGFMWSWHKSHHEPREGSVRAERLVRRGLREPGHRGDLFRRPWHAVAAAVGLGITAYGLMYFIFHDGMVHRRFKTPFGKSAFWKRAIQAHRIHHAVHTKHGAVSFGFLWAKPVRELKAQLKAMGVDA